MSKRLKIYSKNNIGLIPTYSCNAFCKFCYARKLKKEFPKDMSWPLFVKTIKRCQRENKNEISFFGGEPTFWKYIDKAVNYLKNKKIQVDFFTNGLLFSKIPPDCVMINIYNFYKKENREKIRKSILFYSNHRTEVGVRYNVIDKSLDKNDEFFINFVKSMHNWIDYVSISPAVPYGFTRNLGNRLFKLAVKLRQNNFKTKITRAIPICLFNHKQFKYLRQNCFLQTECFSEKNIIINPDGKTLFPCVHVFERRDWTREKFTKIVRDFRQYFLSLSRCYSSACQDCDFAKQQRCQGGCLGAKFIFNLN